MGCDKLTLPFGGQTLLESALSRFSAEFPNVVLSVADSAKYPEITAKKNVDIFPGAGAMSGLHAALTNLPDNGIFLVAADLPYSCPRAAKRIIEMCGDHDVCLIRLDDGKLEPLFGYYRSTILPRCDEAIKSGEYRMSELLLGADTRFITTDDLGGLWDDKIILNVNRPEEYDMIRQPDPPPHHS